MEKQKLLNEGEEIKEEQDTKIIEQTEKELDIKDDLQIEESIRGRIIEEYAYQFRAGGRMVTGLSYAGVMAAVRKQGNIKVLAIQSTEDKDHYKAEATVRDEARNIEVKGFAMQRKFYPGGMPDEFAFVKACGKAQRNGLRKVIDEAMGKAILEEALVKLRQKQADAKAFM